MFRFVLDHKIFLSLLISLSFIGVVWSELSYIAIPTMILLVPKYRTRFSYLIAGLLFLLVLSDNMLPYFGFAANLKVFYILTLTLLLFFSKVKIETKFFYPFILFFTLASIAILYSPVVFDSITKSVSYALLLVIVPSYLTRLLAKDKYNFLRLIIITGIIIFITGLVLRVVSPALSMPRGRFSGLLGNPNGLGIFSVMFTMLVFIIFHYYPGLFPKKQKIFLYISIILSLILSGSRGGIFALAIFFIFQFLNKRSKIISIVTVIAMGISYQVIESHFVGIVQSLGLQDYFRVESLNEGSGRKVAFEFAWSKIQEDPYQGHGIGYTEALMKANAEELSEEGHEGNVHNSYLTIWLDTGLFGLIAFIFGWGYWFFKANKYSHFALPVLFAVLLSTNVESWLAASLNPFTIQLVFILTLLTSKEFIYGSERYKGKVV